MKILKREMYDFFGAYDEKRVKKPLSQWKFFSCHRHFGAVLSILIFVKFNYCVDYVLLCAGASLMYYLNAEMLDYNVSTIYEYSNT